MLDPNSLHEHLEYLTRKWPERIGLACAEILATSLTIAIISALDFEPKWKALTLAVVAIGVFTSWIISRHPRKTPPNRVGFLVALYCENDRESEKLRSDFIIPLKENLNAGETGRTIQFIELPQHISRGIETQDDATALRLKYRGHYMIFGRVRKRQINGKSTHVIELKGNVAHRSVDTHIQKKFAQEFSELLPQNWLVEEENDYFSLSFSAEWAEIVARYIIGIAAMISGDPDYAELMFRDAQARLAGRDKGFPVYQKLTERLPKRIAETHHIRVVRSYNKWTQSYADDALSEFDHSIRQYQQCNATPNPQLRHLLAIWHFLIKRDVRSAKQELKHLKDAHPALWHYNIGFLDGYAGNLQSAIRHYKLAFKHQIEAQTIAEIEEFICWVLDKEPQATHLHYCLGLFNWKVKGDLHGAITDLERFLQGTDPTTHLKEREFAADWINEIQLEVAKTEKDEKK